MCHCTMNSRTGFISLSRSFSELFVYVYKLSAFLYLNKFATFRCRNVWPNVMSAQHGRERMCLVQINFPFYSVLVSSFIFIVIEFSADAEIDKVILINQWCGAYFAFTVFVHLLVNTGYGTVRKFYHQKFNTDIRDRIENVPTMCFGGHNHNTLMESN